MKRAQQQAIIEDLDKKMVLLAGPRQAGKTWLSKNIAQSFSNTVYLNYDRLSDRKIIQEEAWLDATNLLIFDELHKMPEWKNYLKGIYDTRLPHQRMLVTGSARLEIFHQVGDSLAGRYFLHHLLPYSPAEIKIIGGDISLDHFLNRGGFPEPLLAKSDIIAERWRKQYTTSLVHEDVLNFDNIQNLKSIQLVFELLRHRVGSTISYQSIAEDVAVSPNTVKKYIQILEALYIVFRVTPYSKNIARSLLKEPKIYFFDTGLVKADGGAKLENFTAQCLLKHMYAKIDYEAKDFSLHYLRTKDKQEVDFALAQDGEVNQIIEVKTADASISKSLKMFHEKYGYPAVQIVKELKQQRKVGNIELMTVKNFLEGLLL